MKALGKILKFVAALAAIAGTVYVAINYGDKIVAWVKEKLNLTCCCGDDCCCNCDCEDAPVEDAAEEATEVESEEPAVQVEETDFEG